MRIYFLLIILVILTNNLYSTTKEEVVFSTTSSFVVQKDSIQTKYKKAKELFEKQDYVNSLEIALEATKTSSFLNVKETILLNQLIANIFYKSRNNKNALIYYRRTLKLIKNIALKENSDNISKNFDFTLAEVYLNYGNIYYRLNSINNLKKNKDSALYFYNMVDKIKTKDNDVLEVKSRAYSNSSVIYMNDGVFDKAKNYALKAIEIHKKLNNKVNEAGALGNLSSIYLSENNFNEAKKIYFQAIDLIRNINTTKALKVREDLYYNLAYNLYKLKDYKAYDYQELSYIIKDSLRDKEFRGMIAEITEKYNFDVKKNLLLKEEENKRLKDQRIFWIVGIGGLIVILSLLYWVNFYKLKQKNLGLQLSQNQLIQNQNIEKIKSESQVRILNATIDGKESERKQIAETLHDSVSALLSSANLHLQAHKKSV